jgi:hypothetical protein
MVVEDAVVGVVAHVRALDADPRLVPFVLTSL